MKKTIACLVQILLTAHAFAQKENFDIASYAAPQGWLQKDTLGTRGFFHSVTSNGQKQFCQIILFKSTASSGNADKDFATAWKNLVALPFQTKTKPLIQTQKTPEGFMAITGAAPVQFRATKYNTLLTVLTGFAKTMTIQVNFSGSDYAPVVDNFFKELEIDKDTMINNNSTNNMGTMNVVVSLNDYDFIAPEKWQQQNKGDYLFIQNMQSGCNISILAPQPSSGNLEQDAKSVFETMYKGWQYQQSGEQQYTLSKGVLKKGLEYFMMEAPMSMTGTDGRYTIEEGVAMVVKANTQIVIIAVRHVSAMMGHDDCYRKYNTWRRFFNSFTVKNVALPKNNEQPDAQRIVGLWKLNTVGVALGEYAFAANGNYQFGGGLGSSTTTSDMYYKYIYNRAYPFEGDGNYTVSGNQLTLNKRGKTSEQAEIRFEKVNNGGAGWKERIWMLKKNEYGEYEVMYDKQLK